MLNEMEVTIIKKMKMMEGIFQRILLNFSFQLQHFFLLFPSEVFNFKLKKGKIIGV